MPLGVASLMKNKALNWQFDTVPEMTQNNRAIFNPRDKL
jgi:hypothetical protein